MTNRKFIREINNMIDKHLHEQTIDAGELYHLQRDINAWIEVTENEALTQDGFQ